MQSAEFTRCTPELVHGGHHDRIHKHFTCCTAAKDFTLINVQQFVFCPYHVIPCSACTELCNEYEEGISALVAESGEIQ